MCVSVVGVVGAECGGWKPPHTPSHGGATPAASSTSRWGGLRALLPSGAQLQPDLFMGVWSTPALPASIMGVPCGIPAAPTQRARLSPLLVDSGLSRGGENSQL